MEREKTKTFGLSVTACVFDDSSLCLLRPLKSRTFQIYDKSVLIIEIPFFGLLSGQKIFIKSLSKPETLSERVKSLKLN